ncbi:hypothetical protein JB92DRAFT_2597344, partial [Gautieria morchelliformis]
KLLSYFNENLSELQAKYHKINTAERKLLQQELIELREDRAKVRRVHPKAMQKDVNATFSAMDREWSAAHERTGMEGFYIAVRGDVEQYHEPKVWFSGVAENFVKDVLNLDPKWLALQLESYVIAGLDKGHVNSKHLGRKAIVSECHQIIQEGLASILLKYNILDKPLMNYENYERRVVENWGVVIQG